MLFDRDMNLSFGMARYLEPVFDCLMYKAHKDAVCENGMRKSFQSIFLPTRLLFNFGTYINTYICIHMYTRAHTYIIIYLSIYTHIYINTYINIYVHIHIYFLRFFLDIQNTGFSTIFLSLSFAITTTAVSTTAIFIFISSRTYLLMKCFPLPFKLL